MKSTAGERDPFAAPVPAENNTMEPKVQCDFFDKKKYSGKEIGVSELIAKIADSQKQLISIPVTDIIAVLDRFGNHLLERHNPIHKLYPMSGIPFIATWCQRQNLEKLIQTAFSNSDCLDRFVDSAVRSDRSYRAFPRGVAVHWMAGNVPTLGFLSMIMGLLTKNGNILKLAKGANDLLSSLLEQLVLTDGDGRCGGDFLASSLAVVRYDHEEVDIGSAMSRQADIRIIWGGDDAVNAIKRLPTKTDNLDIIFPNRTSFMIIGTEITTPEELIKTARRAAMDISIFEQKACASPHTILLLTEKRETLERFAQALHAALQDALKSIPKAIPSEKEISALLNLRAQYDMFNDAWYSSGTEFTILSDDKLQLGPAIGNRTVYLRMTTDLDRIAELITPNVQSVGIQVDPGQFEYLTNRLGEKGVQRFTRLGAMTHFESPWDGYFVPQHLVRWTSRQKT